VTACLRVLLVEDDEDHVFLVRRALADLAGVAVTVEVAGDGEQAVRRLAQARFEPGGLPQVVLTSSERREDREEALRQGATWFVGKPTDGRRFRSEVQQLGDRWARAGA
jgi:CheY-like chemotaxis protein